MIGKYALLATACLIAASCAKKVVVPMPADPAANKSPEVGQQNSPEPTPGASSGSPVASSSGPSTGSPDPKSTNEARSPNSPTTRPGISRPFRPELPKPEETVAGSYDTGSNKVEIEGGCKVTEDSVNCWRADGSDYPELEQKVKKSFDDPNGYGRGQIRISYGKKNRVIVFKTTQSRTRSAEGGHASIMQVGDDQNGSFMNLELNEPMTNTDMNQPYVRLEARGVSAEPTATSTTARLTVSTTAPERPDIECKVGASGVVGGQKFTLFSIEPYKPEPGMYGGMPNQGPQWKLTFKRSGTTGKQIHFYASPKAANGSSISYVTETGDPVSSEEYSKAMQAMMQNRSDPRAYEKLSRKYRSAQGMSVFSQRGRPNPDVVEIVTAVNPKKIGKLGLNGSYSKIVELTGILLDGN